MPACGGRIICCTLTHCKRDMPLHVVSAAGDRRQTWRRSTRSCCGWCSGCSRPPRSARSRPLHLMQCGSFCRHVQCCGMVQCTRLQEFRWHAATYAVNAYSVQLVNCSGPAVHFCGPIVMPSAFQCRSGAVARSTGALVWVDCHTAQPAEQQRLGHFAGPALCRGQSKHICGCAWLAPYFYRCSSR